MELAGDYPDVLVGCTGGGSNFAGLAFPFLGQKLARRQRAPRHRGRAGRVPDAHAGPFAYDFGDTGHLTPLVKMHTLGSTFVPPGFHAGGLRYHGDGAVGEPPARPRADRGGRLHQTRCFEAGVQLRARRGHPAGARGDPRRPGAIDEAVACREEGVGGDDPLQPLGPRSLRHAGLHRPLRRASSRTSSTTRASSRWLSRACPPSQAELSGRRGGGCLPRARGTPARDRAPAGRRARPPRLGPGERADEQLDADRQRERLVGERPAEGHELLRPRTAREDVAVGDGAHRHVRDEGRPSEAGTATAIGFVPVSGGPPAGCGRRRGDVAVTTATSPASAIRRAQPPSIPVGKHDAQTTSRTCSGGSSLQARADGVERQIAEGAAAVPALEALAPLETHGRTAARRARRRAALRARGRGRGRGPACLPRPPRRGARRRPSRRPREPRRGQPGARLVACQRTPAQGFDHAHPG